MPVAWRELEPQEGHFDFSVPDHWIEVARREHLHLVFLWFGSWKNAFSEYAPEWVLADTERFPREISAQGLPLEILSPLGQETERADSRAFAALMQHLRAEDAAQQTVVMVQVENEIGFPGVGGRDRSPEANRLFAGAVPSALLASLRARGPLAAEELHTTFNPGGRTWSEVFGRAADEIFMAWYYGRFVEQVAAAGKQAYNLPMYMNAQLPAPFEAAAHYPSGGPYPKDQPIYRAAAPSIDFYAPDIYWPNFEEWVQRYKALGNVAFVPEARLDEAPFNALWLYGEARGFGYSPFAVDSLPIAAVGPGETGPRLPDVYALLTEMSHTILAAQQRDAIRALVLHKTSWRPVQTVSLGGFLFSASLERGWPSMDPLESDGALMVMEAAPETFYVLGSGLRVEIERDPDTDSRVAGIAEIDEGSLQDGQWITRRVLNGDQSDQGRALLMDPHQPRRYRVRLYVGAASRR